MENKIFRKKIEEVLKNMSKEQIVLFAWLCAIRALPFIGAKGNFNYWRGREQNYLYALFRVLDVNKCYYADTYANVYAADRADRAAAAVAYSADPVANAAIIAAVNAAATYADNGANAVKNAINAAENAVNATNTDDIRAKMQKILLSDIEAIQKGDKTFDSHFELYGEIWKNFLQALDNEGCSYWGNLYEDIFEKSFILDSVALERRMNVPKEIQEKGAKAVAGYLKEMEKGATHLNEARIIILGEKGSGKTCLARRLINPYASMTTDKESTAGVDTMLWKLEQDNMNVHIWDFAGHVVTHAVHQFFLSERCLYILVYDGRTEERNRMEYWLDHIKNYGGNSKVFIQVNKRDENIPEISINSLKEEYPIAGVYTFSIDKDKNKLEDFRKEVTDYIKNNPSWSNLKIPDNYFNVKKELEQRFENKKDEYIDIDNFKKIAIRNKVNDFEGLLKNLHALGICLCYENLKDFNTLVLNPEWISHGIYKIINWVHNQGKHSIEITDFPTVFGNNNWFANKLFGNSNDAVRYPKNKHRFLFELMIRYELAYETENKDCLIIPHLLHEDRPKILPNFPESESLMLRYKSEQPLPPNPVSRFIVRHREEIKKENEEILVWRYGVVLEDGKGSTALVRESKKERMISVWVTGKDKTAYLNKLRETLNDIFDSYKSKKPELLYKIEGLEQLPFKPEEPLMVSASQIVANVENNIPYAIPQTRELVDLRHTAAAYGIILYAPNATNLTVNYGKEIHSDSSSQTFNFHNCNIDLQGNLNDLASSLKIKGEIEEAEILEDAAKVLTESEECKTPEEVKKKGITNKLRRIVEELGNENSKLHRTVKGIKHGISIAQDIAKGYNDIAQWCGFPQVPKPFLGK